MAPTLHRWSEFAKETLAFHQEVRRQFQALEKETMAIPVLARELELLRGELMGNGQPGRIVNLELRTQNAELKTQEHGTRLDDAEGRLGAYGGRIRGLEKFRWFAAGAIAVLGPLALWALGAALRIFGS